MSFNPGLGPVFLKIIKPALEEAGFICKRGDDPAQSSSVMNQVIKAIKTAQLIVCDLTNANQNVYYELGIAQAFERPTILLSQNMPPESFPFDIRHLRITMYEEDKFSLLQLRDDLRSIIQEVAPQVKNRAASQKISYGNQKDELESARSFLYHFSPDAKRYAVRYLGETRDKESYDKIKHIIENARHGEAEADLARDGLTALWKINAKRALDDIVSLGIFNRSHLVRERAVALIGEFRPDRNLIEGMLRQITDSSWGVRVAVCRALGSWAQAQQLPSAAMIAEVLKSVRRSDPEFAVRVAAEAALNDFFLSQKSVDASPQDSVPIDLETEIDSSGLAQADTVPGS